MAFSHSSIRWCNLATLSKDHTRDTVTKGSKKTHYLRTENLKNHTLFRGTYLYSPYMGVPSPGFRRTARWTFRYPLRSLWPRSRRRLGGEAPSLRGLGCLGRPDWVLCVRPPRRKWSECNIGARQYEPVSYRPSIHPNQTCVVWVVRFYRHSSLRTCSNTPDTVCKCRRWERCFCFDVASGRRNSFPRGTCDSIAGQNKV